MEKISYTKKTIFFLILNVMATTTSLKHYEMDAVQKKKYLEEHLVTNYSRLLFEQVSGMAGYKENISKM